MLPVSSSYRIGMIYIIHFKNYLIRPFYTIFYQIGQAGPVDTSGEGNISANDTTTKKVVVESH